MKNKLFLSSGLVMGLLAGLAFVRPVHTEPGAFEDMGRGREKNKETTTARSAGTIGGRNAVATTPGSAGVHFFGAADPRFLYTGRIDFSDPARPRFWAAGVYLRARFEGNTCRVIVHDQVVNEHTHNYIGIVIDDHAPIRIKAKSSTDTIDAWPEKLMGRRLSGGMHTITVCKDTESGIGWLAFGGLLCKKLLAPPARPSRRIEFIGNSITTGTGSDLSDFPCGQGEWYDQHNAYLSYGPLTSRSLDAEWQLTAVAGIGLIHSCCKLEITMPQVFDKMNQRADSVAWDFAGYRPDVVTVSLGQNDGVQDSLVFCRAYVDFIRQIRSRYPEAQIVCLTSPMGNEKLTTALKKYLQGVVDFCHGAGDGKVSCYFYSRSFNKGCGGHPDLSQHIEIAGELSAYIRKLMHW